MEGRTFMKTILVLTLGLATVFTIIGCAGEQAKATETTNISVKGAQCNTCVATIEKAVGKLDGVQSVSVDLDEKLATVEYVASKLDVSRIEKAIADAGYDANDTRKNEEAYQELPACCQ